MILLLLSFNFPTQWNITQPQKNEIMLYAATWMDLELIILSEVRERQISYDNAIGGILKNDTNELIYKTEIDPQTEKINSWLPKEKWGEG